MEDMIFQLMGFASIFVAILAAGWKLSSKLSCARGLAEEAMKEAEEAIRRVERAEDQARETHQSLYDKLDEIKDIVSKLDK